MEIKITTNQVLKVLQVLSWIIFIGLCIEAGAIIVNTVISGFINPNGVKNFWEGSDYLTNLLQFDRGYFLVITFTMIIVAVLKAIMFYLIVALFIDKKLNITQPFSTELRRFILKLAYLALGIGLFAHVGHNYANWLTKQGAPIANFNVLNIEGADVWIFMGVVLFVIVQVVNRGIEIQNENDLTI